MLDETLSDRLRPGAYIGGAAMGSMEHWRRQEAPCSCAIAAQGFVLGEVSGVDHPAAVLVSLARDNGWYHPGGGTSPDDVGRIVEHYGIPVERHLDVPMDRLAAALAAGARVLVAVDTEELEHPGGYDPADPVDHFPGIPGQNPVHAVQVIGIDATEPARATVVLNDPSRADGQGLIVPADVFVEAWGGSGFFMVTAAGR